MKLKNLLLLPLAAVLFIVGCQKGPQGDPGPQGPQGSPGAPGATGAAGAPGTANVIYSPWYTIDSSRWTYSRTNHQDSTIGDYTTFGNNDTLIIYHADIPTPGITQSILDSGMIFYYFKDSTGDPATIGKAFPWIPSVSNSRDVGVTNRADGVTHFEVWSGDTYTKDKITVYTYWLGYDRRDGVTPNIPHPEVIPGPKTKCFMRYVAIPGKTGTGRYSMHGPVDFKDYDAVRKYYAIPD